MLGRVVERVAHADALKNQFRRLADDLGVARLTAAEGARVDLGEPLAERIGEDLGKIEQESLPTPSRIMGRSLASFPACLLPPLLDPIGRSRSDRAPLSVRHHADRRLYGRQRRLRDSMLIAQA